MFKQEADILCGLNTQVQENMKFSYVELPVCR